MENSECSSPPPFTLKQYSLDIIGIHFDQLLDAFELKHLPQRHYEYLQRTSSRELLKKMKGRFNLGERYVDFFINTYIHELDLDPFDPTQIIRILQRLSAVGKTLTSFRLTRFVYPKTMLSQLITLLPNIESLCLNKTRCSDKTLKCIADNCPLLKVLDINECFDINDAGIKCFCKLSEDAQVIPNYTLEELDIWATDISINGVIFAIQNFPNLTKLNHYLLCSAIFTINFSSGLKNVDIDNSSYKKYNFKELKIHPVNSYNTHILETYSVLCPCVTSLQIYGIETQEEVNVCQAFDCLTEVSFFNTPRGLQFLSLTPFIQARGSNLIKLELGYCCMSLESLAIYCPNLQSLYLQHCKLEDLEYLLAHPHSHTLNTLEALTLDDMAHDEVEDTIRLVITASPNLVHLTLLYMNCIDNLIDDITSCSFIPSLRVVEIMFSDPSISAISRLMTKMPKLEKLFLNNCKISGASLLDTTRFQKQNTKVQLTVRDDLHLGNSNLLNSAPEFRELWGYGFDYEDEFDPNLDINDPKL